MKISIYQQELLGKIPENDFKVIKSYSPDFLVLPEYFFHPDLISYDDSIKYIIKISKELNCTVIGGTTVLEENKKLFNCCYVYRSGEYIGHYCKINLFEREIGKINPGNRYKVFILDKIKIGILICADVLYKEAWNNLKRLKPDIIFIPTFSPYKTESVEEKYLRDEKIFINGAKISNSIIVKVCCIGKYKGTKLQGRSLVCDKNHIIWRVKPEEEDMKIIKNIEI